MDRLTLAALFALVAIPLFVVPMTLRDVQVGQAVGEAPLQSLRVREKWIVAPGTSHSEHWVSFVHPTEGRSWKVRLSQGEWTAARRGETMTMAMVPGAGPQSVYARVNPASQWVMLGTAAAAFVAAAAYLCFRLFETLRRGPDLSPAAEMARRASHQPGATFQRPRF